MMEKLLHTDTRQFTQLCFDKFSIIFFTCMPRGLTSWKDAPARQTSQLFHCHVKTMTAGKWSQVRVPALLLDDYTAWKSKSNWTEWLLSDVADVVRVGLAEPIRSPAPNYSTFNPSISSSSTLFISLKATRYLLAHPTTNVKKTTLPLDSWLHFAISPLLLKLLCKALQFLFQ